MRQQTERKLSPKDDLKLHLVQQHPNIVSNYGPQFHRATLRDLTVSHAAWHHKHGPEH